MSEREREREREREHAKISERVKLQSKCLLKFSYRKILSNIFFLISSKFSKEKICLLFISINPFFWKIKKYRAFVVTSN